MLFTYIDFIKVSIVRQLIIMHRKHMSKLSIRDLWVILAGYLAAIHMGKLSVVLPILQKDLNLTLTQAGLSLSIVQGAGMLFALSIGAFSEKLGLKRCLVFALIIMGLSSLAGPWLDTVALLYFFRFIEGIGFLTISLCAPAILKRISKPETISFKMGLWSSYMGLGISFAVFTIPLLLEYLTWQNIWVILGIACFVIALIIQLFLNIDDSSQTIKSPVSAAQNSLWQIIRITITHPPIICLAIAFACYTSQWIAVTGFLPSIYVETGLSLKTAGLLVSLVVLANLGGTFGAGMLLQKSWTAQKLLIIGFIGMFITSILTFTTNSWLAFEMQFLSAVLFSMIGGVIPTTILSMTLHYTPHINAAAASVGLLLQCSASAQFFIPLFSAAFVSATHTWASMSIVTSLLCLLGLFIMFVFFKRYAK